MKVGLFFGSFNPIHHGHLIIANQAIVKKLVDQVWIIVTPQNPFKKKNDLINEYNRLHLVKLAIEDCPSIKVSDVEFKLPRPSYTINTLAFLKELYPEKKFVLIIGADSHENILRWKEGKKIVEEYELIVYKRKGFDIGEPVSEKVLKLDNPLIEISSTGIRESIKAGESIKFLTPDKVITEIERCALYKNS
jgi:nicotinate-nucleotide adenylyltransferase